MGIFRRLQDILSANLNDLIEGFEDPETMLRQAIREMEEAANEAMEKGARAIACEKLLASQLGAAEREVRLLGDRAAAAVKEGDDDLARDSLEGKARAEETGRALRIEWQAAKDASSRVRKDLDDVQEMLAGARRKFLALSARKKAADARREIEKTTVTSLRTHAGAASRFERMRDRIEREEAEAEGWREIRAGLGGKPLRGRVLEVESRARVEGLSEASGWRESPRSPVPQCEH